MKTAIIQQNQTVLDMIVMACGTLEGAMQVMAANNTSLSDTTYTGTVYAVPDTVSVDKQVLDYLQQNDIHIGTFLTAL